MDGSARITGCGRDDAPGTLPPIGEVMLRHMRSLHLLKSKVSQVPPLGAEVEWSAMGVLMTLVSCGPVRQGELAERHRLDPSTVSRSVAQLVRSGLVERRPDPLDGRAVQLAVTDHGAEVAARASRHFTDLLERLVHDWPAEDVRQLRTLLERLTERLVADARDDARTRTDH